MFYEGGAAQADGGALLVAGFHPGAQADVAEQLLEPEHISRGAPGATGYCFAAGRHGGFSGQSCERGKSERRLVLRHRRIL